MATSVCLAQTNAITWASKRGCSLEISIHTLGLVPSGDDPGEFTQRQANLWFSHVKSEDPNWLGRRIQIQRITVR